MFQCEEFVCVFFFLFVVLFRFFFIFRLILGQFLLISLDVEIDSFAFSFCLFRVFIEVTLTEVATQQF